MKVADDRGETLRGFAKTRLPGVCRLLREPRDAEKILGWMIVLDQRIDSGLV